MSPVATLDTDIQKTDQIEKSVEAIAEPILKPLRPVQDAVEQAPIPSQDPTHVPPPAKVELAVEVPFEATIPVLDMNEFYVPSLRAGFVAKLLDAMKTTGFFAVVNPGVNVEALNQAYASAEAFFALPFEQKEEIRDPKNSGQRGYVPGETAKGQKLPDFKEFLHIGREVSDEEKRGLGSSKNLWPSSMDLKGPMVALFDALEKHIVPLQQAMAEALNVPSNLFVDMTHDGDNLLRALHYFANPPEGSMWASAHTDIDLFTILPKATAEGLQILNQYGEWIDVRVPENAFIVNVGDMMQNITNGLCRSAVHQVKAKEGNYERFSMVFFIHPRSECSLAPLAHCIEQTGGVKRFADATRLELLLERLADLGLLSGEGLKTLGESGVMDRLLAVDRASVKAMLKLREAGFASANVLEALQKIESVG